MSEYPKCPECSAENTYSDGENLVCPDCGHEWLPGGESESETESGTGSVQGLIVKDAFGTVLQDGDSITIVKELKVKGASGPLKIGTKVKKIRLVEGDHNIDCRIEGFGAMQLKSEFVKKA
jgi:protein PhnA